MEHKGTMHTYTIQITVYLRAKTEDDAVTIVADATEALYDVCEDVYTEWPRSVEPTEGSVTT